MKFKTTYLIFAAFFAALTAAGAFITIPIPYVPFTLQLLFCIMSGIILGPKPGMLSQVVYVMLGLFGLPIFAGGHGGFSSIFTPSFGYLIGFIFAPYIAGSIFLKIGKTNFITILISCLAGVLVVYLFGLPYLYLILKFYLNNPKNFWWITQNYCIVFLAGDLVKCIIISLISIKVLPRLGAYSLDK